MERIKFLRTITTVSAGFILMPEIALARKPLDSGFLNPESPLIVDDDANAQWLFDVIVDVGIKVLGKGIYTGCVYGLKNPRVCSIIEWLATEILSASKNTIKAGIQEAFKYRIERGQNEARIKLQTATMDDALDATSVMAHSSCNSWKYLKDIGKYPQASRVQLGRSDVSYLSKDELAIMRNEIFARHGYIFHKNPAVMNHFNAQTWYRKYAAKTKDDAEVWKHFSDIEKDNIKLIKSYE
jgi:YARHG domain